MSLHFDKVSGRYIHLGKDGFHNLSEITKVTRIGKKLKIDKKDGKSLTYDGNLDVELETALKKEGK